MDYVLRYEKCLKLRHSHTFDYVSHFCIIHKACSIPKKCVLQISVYLIIQKTDQSYWIKNGMNIHFSGKSKLPLRTYFTIQNVCWFSQENQLSDFHLCFCAYVCVVQYVCACCVCVYVYEKQKSMSGNCYLSPPYSLTQGLSLFLESPGSARLASQLTLRIHLSVSPVLALQVLASCCCFYVGAGEFKCRPSCLCNR